MKISELEKALSQIRSIQGDLDVICITPDCGGYDYTDGMLTPNLMSIGYAPEKPYGVGEDIDRQEFVRWLHIGQPATQFDNIWNTVWNKVNLE